MKLEKYKKDNKKLESEIQDLAEQFENLNHQKKELVDEIDMMNEISSLKDSIERLKKQNKETLRKYNDLKSQCSDHERRVHAKALEREKTILINNDHLNKEAEEDLRTLEDNYTRKIKKITEKLKVLQIENENLCKKLKEQTDETKKQLDLKDAAWTIINDFKKSAQNKPEVTEIESQSIDVSCQTELSKKPNTIEALDGSRIEDTNK